MTRSYLEIDEIGVLVLHCIQVHDDGDGLHDSEVFVVAAVVQQVELPVLPPKNALKLSYSVGLCCRGVPT